MAEISERDDRLLMAASDVAYEKIEACHGDLSQLTDPWQTIYCVYHGTVIINNGGLLDFFGYDFPFQPSYFYFVEAYRRIGCLQQANALQQAVDSFEMANPESDVLARRNFIETNYDEDLQEVCGWTDCISDEVEVWLNLAQWIRAQKEAESLESSSRHPATRPPQIRRN